MVERDAKSEPCATEAKELQRHYTVDYAPNGGKKPPSPQVKLSSKWLEDLGFNTGQPVIVTVERGKLVIETELRF
ncbi:type I toxin-antitoxin system SymE family toxin [Candidatus Symbiopectobacterium sp. NZEC127]|uniref:SymE family type I addiction module toxin n=1 Tax=Candidatus Symbiopectobacterium sp. NZEC127 TaxID=2820472 RepID=UPI002226E93F|nr:type I toxin-antitoxin system SymE family toxin [Candidatus Symbiopectobacterium sp. NZEC127]MCW2485257.1 type I toxin-antitoxin system SymE family toxin [Candidatus Symbiopectobacterium sp. NZEC127]